MKLIRATATFGKLEGATLTFGDGLNLMEMPNEGGKSTWCAFLRAMFYGIPTRERDTKTTLAEKNRYQPWSGSPMAGELELEWGGDVILLRRGQKGNNPMAAFQAVYRDTGAIVPNLTGDNCGEMLLGVGRETFQRTAFVGQSGVPIDGDPELERRIASLVSTGEEDVSYSQVEKTLKTWLNRRKHNKTGLIPKMEEELAGVSLQLDRLHRNAKTLTDGQNEVEQLTAQKERLEAQLAAVEARQNWAMNAQYQKAVGQLETARQQLAQVEQRSGQLPPKNELLDAQGQLAHHQLLTAQIKEAEVALPQAEAKVEGAKWWLSDPILAGRDPETVWQQGQRDYEATNRGLLPLWVPALLLVALVAGAGYCLWQQLTTAVIPVGSGLGIMLVVLIMVMLQHKKRNNILKSYNVERPQGILDWVSETRRLQGVYETAQAGYQAVADSLAGLNAQRATLWTALLDFVHQFEPGVTDGFGISAALSKGLTLEEAKKTAQIEVNGAQQLVSQLPYPATLLPKDAPEPPAVPHSMAETVAGLRAVQGELQRVTQMVAGAQGQAVVLGDMTQLAAQKERLTEALTQRQGEYEAIRVAMETLEGVNGQLSARFSPQLNQLAGRYFAILTGGKYQSLTLDREFSAMAQETGAVLPHSAMTLSRGTVDQLYLAVRLAVCDLTLPKEEPVPLVLDDALNDFDEVRLGLALQCLKELGRQVVVFSCRKLVKSEK